MSNKGCFLWSESLTKQGYCIMLNSSDGSVLTQTHIWSICVCEHNMAESYTKSESVCKQLILQFAFFLSMYYRALFFANFFLVQTYSIVKNGLFYRLFDFHIQMIPIKKVFFRQKIVEVLINSLILVVGVY